MFLSEVLRPLVKRPQVDPSNLQGATPLHVAAEAAQLLGSSGAVEEAPNKGGLCAPRGAYGPYTIVAL